MSLQKTFLWPHSPNHGETFEGWATESRQLSASLRPMLAHRTSESGGGCLLPTPTATNTKAVHMRSGGRPPRSYLPTPTANCGTGPGHSGRTGGLNLQTHVARWPTPRASDGERGGRGELLHMVKGGTPRGPLMATPTATANQLSPSMMKHPGCRAWATPTTQDAHNNGAPSQQERNTKPLNAQVGGALNPAFVAWLMAFPIGWLNCEHSAMRRFRAWQRRHSGCSWISSGRS